nr:alytesin [Alytes sp.]
EGRLGTQWAVGHLM